MKRKVLFIIAAITLLWQVSSAQTEGNQQLGGGPSTSFSYQGSLKIAGAPANGNYDFEFRFFNASTGGTQIGSTITQSNLAVQNGVFTTVVDIGNLLPPVTSGTNYLEVRVRPAGGGAFTTLTPREAVVSVPYAMRSLDSERLGGLGSSQYVTTTTGGANFIQNTTTQQTSSNFNISGTGTANIFAAATQFNIGANRVLSNAGTFNIFAGVGAGQANTTGSFNSFFGKDSGHSNTTGQANSFFGVESGFSNTTGESNSFFGVGSGYSNTNARYNSFFGIDSGSGTTTGSFNSFFGLNSGRLNTTGSHNTTVGYFANVASGNLINATAIGNMATVGSSNSLVLGGVNGFNNCETSFGCDTVNVGIGTINPSHRLHVVGENLRVEGNTSAIFPRFSLNFTGGGADAKKWQNYAATDRLRFSALNDAENSENIWLDVVRSGTNVTGVNFVSGVVSINQLGAAGATALCRNASNQISTCSSSARYKQNINSYKSGLNLIKQLRPVSFNWKSGGMADLGLVAEEVAEVEPLLMTANDRGEVEGVKYDRIGVIAVNAIKEQQTQIEAQAKEIAEQKAANQKLQAQIDALKELVCSQNPTAAVCKK